MTKEETISNIKAYLDGDTAIGNIISLRSILESAMKYLSKPSLPSNLDEVAEKYAKDRAKDPEQCYEYLYYEILKAIQFGAEWMAGQEQADAELEEEITRWLEKGDITDTRFDNYDDSDIERTARHFYELGLNAKKED